MLSPARPWSPRHLREQREIGRRFQIGRRHGHQAGDGKARRACFGEQRRQIVDRATALLCLVADIDLKEARGAPALLRHRPAKRRDQRGPIDRVDRIEQRDRVFRLVRLELTDQVKLDVGPGLAQGGPFRLRFLNPVLAENAVPGGEQRV